MLARLIPAGLVVLLPCATFQIYPFYDGEVYFRSVDSGFERLQKYREPHPLQAKTLVEASSKDGELHRSLLFTHPSIVIAVVHVVRNCLNPSM